MQNNFSLKKINNMRENKAVFNLDFNYRNFTQIRNETSLIKHILFTISATKSDFLLSNFEMSVFS
jgi:hypothetical protein